MEDKKIKKIIETGLLKKAPEGMMDRIMANLAVNPARRLSVTPIEPKPIIALILPFLMLALLALGVFLKPKTFLSFSIDLPLSLSISPIWVAPVVAVSFIVWTYIAIVGNQKSKT
ncbi:MAG: hypothetical protein L3J29_01555 [Cyclobacteriaceae bacterium]|nr:hypothetical protein [Cyclobacteriaceae bacterium]